MCIANGTVPPALYEGEKLVTHRQDEKFDAESVKSMSFRDI